VGKFNNRKTHEQLGREYDAWRTGEPPAEPRTQEPDEDAERMEDEAKWDYEPPRRIRLFDEAGWP